MDVLAGRKTGGVITGDIRVNGGWRRLQTSMDRLAHRQCAKLHTNGNVRKLAEGQFYLYAHCCLAPTAALRAGHPKVHQTFARVMGYCEQTDVHIPHCAVQARPWPAACLCSLLPRTVPLSDQAPQQQGVGRIPLVLTPADGRLCSGGVPGVWCSPASAVKCSQLGIAH